MMAAEFLRNAERSMSALHQQSFASRAMICEAAANEIEALRSQRDEWKAVAVAHSHRP
jgi:hypothetical protein